MQSASTRRSLIREYKYPRDLYFSLSVSVNVQKKSSRSGLFFYVSVNEDFRARRQRRLFFAFPFIFVAIRQVLLPHLHEKSIKNPLFAGALSNASSRNYFFSFLLKFNAVIRQVIFHCLRQKSLKIFHSYGTPSTVHSRNRSWFVLCYAILLPHLHEKSIKNPLLVGALSNAFSRTFLYFICSNAKIRQVIFHRLRQKSLKKSHPYGTPSTVHSRNGSYLCFQFCSLIFTKNQ